MRIFLILLIALIYSTTTKAADLSLHLDKFLKGHWELPNPTKQEIIKGEIVVEVDVSNVEKQQKFFMQATSIHPKSCNRVLRKLSRFESYSQWLSFIEKSQYQETHKLVTIHADHMLLPFPMVVHVIIDRPTTPGVYPFTFPTGIFTGLKGELIIEQHENRCFFYTESKWQGKDTGISNMVIDIFATTLSKIGAEMLMRKTRF